MRCADSSSAYTSDGFASWSVASSGTEAADVSSGALLHIMVARTTTHDGGHSRKLRRSA